MSLKKNIKELTLGIKFARTFRIPDIAGEIIDDILYSSKSPFESRFEQLEESNLREKRLLTSKLLSNGKPEYLLINTENIILSIDTEGKFMSTYSWLKGDVFSFFSYLFLKYKIKNINRIGIVFSHSMELKNISNIIEVLTKNEVLDINNLKINFSKKYVAEQSLYRKDLSDYKNAIFSFEQKESIYIASLDFQYFFDPVIEDIRDCFSDRIFTDAHSFLSEKFYKWVEQYE